MDAPSLGDIMRDEVVEVGTDLPSRWQISDDRGAEWAMRMLVSIELKREGVRTQAAAWMQQIVDWLEHEEKPLSRASNYFDGQLRTYALARRAIDDDAKTLRLPSGDVKTTGHKPTIKITDEPALIQHLHFMKREDLIRKKEDVLVSTLKDAVRVERDPAIYTVHMDCGDTFDTTEPDVRFCRMCGVEGAVMEQEVIAHEQWTAYLGKSHVVVPGVEVVPPHTEATVVTR